jgi:hypothetical protein
MAYINVEIEYKNTADEFDYVDVVLEGEFDWDYDFNDRKVIICENIHWDKSEHTEVENKVIDKYVNDNFDKLSNDLCEEYCK